MRTAGAAELSYVKAFVHDAARAGVIDAAALAELLAELERRSPRLDDHREHAAPTVSSGGLPPPPPRPPAPPAPPAGRLARLRALVASELAVHGLAALGVLLLFAATLGFVLFALGSVSATWRPVAAVGIPGGLFACAAVLRRRGAPLVAGGLDLLAGAVLPVVALGAFASAPAAQAALTVAIAAAYAMVARARPTSALRFLVAPAAWLAVATASVLVTGEVSAVQTAVVAVTVALTVAGTRARPRAALVAPVLGAAAPVAATAFGVGLLLAGRDGWPPLPLLVTGLATGVIAGLLAAAREGVPARDPRLLQLGVTVLTTAGLVPGWGLGWSAAAAVAACLAMVLLERADRPNQVTGVLVAVAGGSALVGTVAEPWALLASASAVAAWGHGHVWDGGRDPRAIIAAAIAPVGAVVGLAWVSSWPTALATAGAALLTLAVAAAVRGRPQVLPAWWLPAAATLLALASGFQVETAHGTITLALAAAAATLVLAEWLPLPARVWWSAPVAFAALGTLLDGLDADPVAALAAFAGAGVLLVAGGSAPRGASPWAHVALLGHLLTLAVFLSGGLETGGDAETEALIGMAALALAWLVSLARSAAGRSWPLWWGAATAVTHGVAAVVWPETFEGLAGVALALTGVAALAAAAWRRDASVALPGMALVLGAAYAAGSGWLALALAAVASGSSLLARTASGTTRRALLACATVATAGAWAAGTVWLGWDEVEALAATAVAGGAVAAAAGSSARWLSRWTGRVDAAAAWLVTGVSAVVLSAAAGPLWFTDGGLWPLTAGLALAALGVGALAAPAHEPLLRELAASLALAAVAAGAEAAALSLVARVWLGVGLSTAGCVSALVLWHHRGGAAWLRPLALASGSAALATVGLAALTLPDRGPLVAALVAVAAQSAAAGLLTRTPALVSAAPITAALAWLLVAGDVLTGEPVWAAVPVGAAMLMEVEIGRWAAREASKPPPDALQALEYLGVVTIGAPILLAIMTDALAYGLLGVVAGSAVAAWGAATQVRRRVWSGGGLVAASLVLVLAVPLAGLLPQIRGYGLWLALAGIGAALVAGATGLERGRVRLEQVRRHVHDLMAGWE